MPKIDILGAGYKLRVMSCELHVARCPLRVTYYVSSMLNTQCLILDTRCRPLALNRFIGLLELHQKLNNASTRNRKRWSEAIPPFVIRQSSIVIRSVFETVS